MLDVSHENLLFLKKVSFGTISLYQKIRCRQHLQKYLKNIFVTKKTERFKKNKIEQIVSTSQKLIKD